MHTACLMSGNCYTSHIFILICFFFKFDLFLTPYYIKEHKCLCNFEESQIKITYHSSYRKGNKYSLGNPTNLWFPSFKKKYLLK